MEIGTIFEIIPEKLLAVLWKGEAEDSFRQYFNAWQDVEYLEDFFEKNKEDLKSDFWKLSVNEAVLKVLDEAQLFESHILNIAEKDNLDDIIFKPLRGDNETNYKRIHSKSYSKTIDDRPPILRIYAVRLDTNLYIVSGGAIKLTKAMQDRDHTDKELKKLTILSSYLKENGIDDNSDYGFIEIENN